MIPCATEHDGKTAVLVCSCIYHAAVGILKVFANVHTTGISLRKALAGCFVIAQVVLPKEVGFCVQGHGLRSQT